ncbi:hypothetical protein D3C76_1154920 [compost metagenome]
MLSVVPGVDALLPGVQRKGFQTTEAEIQARTVAHRPREDETPCNALLCKASDLRSARIIEPHHLGRLVEGLAGGVIQGLAQKRVLTDSVDLNQLRVTTRHQQSDERKFRRLRLQHRRQQMAFHVMHAKGRNAPGKGQRLSTGSPYQQGTNQARTRGVGDRIDLGRHAVGLGQHLTNQGQHAFDVIA